MHNFIFLSYYLLFIIITPNGQLSPNRRHVDMSTQIFELDSTRLNEFWTKVSPEEKPLTIFYRDFGGRIDDLASFLVNGHNQDTPWFVLRSPQVPCPTSAQSNFHNF
jgi:hypothetical protein